MSEILRWGAAETVRQLKAKEVSAVEVCEAHLDRCNAVNPSLNAIVEEVPEALAYPVWVDSSHSGEGRWPQGRVHV